MTRSQKPGSNAASARDRVPAGFFHAPRFEAAARRDSMRCENARAARNDPPGGGTDRRDASPRRCAPHAGADGSTTRAGARRCPASAQEGRRDRDVVRRKSKFSAHPPCCSVHGAQQRCKPGIAHNELFRARKKGTARRAVPASGLRNTQAQGKQRRPPDDAGNKRHEPTRDEHNRRRRERKSRRAQTTPGEKQPPPQRTTPSGTATAAARGARQAMFRRIHPALLLKQTRHAPPFLPQKRDTPRALRKKRRSAKPKFCRTPDRHGSGLARSLNRTFSYRMKLVRMTGSFSGSGTPAALPASKQRSIHAMFLAS